MENTPSTLMDSIAEYLSQLVSLNRRLQKKKVDSQTAKLAFTEVDSKRKGYLDLANIYQLCGQNVTEDQLFHVFKWLDINKSGDVSYEDFEVELTTSQPNLNTEISPLQRVKSLITVFLENLEYSDNLKAKMGFTSQKLTKVYHQICQSQQKTYLAIDDLIYVLSHSKQWDSWSQQQLKELFRNSKSITLKLFIEKFISTKYVDTNLHQQTPKQTQPCQQQLLDDINSEYQSKQIQHTIPSFREVANEQDYRSTPVETTHAPQVRTNNFTRPEVSKSIYQYDQQRQPQSINKKTIVSRSPQQQQQSDAKQVQSMLSNIQKRREQLRRGSLERKKLIEQALSHKRSSAQLTTNYPQSTSPKNYECSNHSSNLNIGNVGSGNSYSRSNSYNNLHSQIDLKKYEPSTNNVGRMFSKYRQQKSSYLNLNENRRHYQPWTKERNQIQPKSHYMSNNSNSPSSRINQGELYGSQIGRTSQQHPIRIVDDNQSMNSGNQYEPRLIETPKFSQTMQDGFGRFSSPSSTYHQKQDKFAQIQRKIDNLHQRPNNQALLEPNPRQIDLIIQKYRKNINEQTNNFQQSRRPQYQEDFRSSPYQVDQNRMESYLKQRSIPLDRYKSSNISNTFSKTYDWKQAEEFSKNGDIYSYQQQQYQQRQRAPTPESYLRDQKNRLNGSIASVRPVSSSGIQKQNLLKRAEEQASRKIMQIERRAKMKVLERKSAVGLKWMK